MKEFFKKNKDYVIIAIVSLIAFVIGCLAINFIISLLIIGLADLCLFIPNLIKNRRKSESGRHVAIARKKTKSSSNKKIKKNNNSKKRKIITLLLLIFLIFSIIVIIFSGLFWMSIVKNAPKFDPKELYHQESSTLYSKNGEKYAELGTETRKLITYEELPEVLINAIVATEDSRFYQHDGFDLPRFTKATLQTILGSNNAGGASTLTMQLVKNHYTSKKKDLTRKFTDIYMAVNQIEKKYTKEEILEFYVNAPYLGGSSYGVEQACQTYFGKSAKDINLAEAAMIAGLFQSPGYDDPTRYPERAERRRQIVLKLMKRHGYINDEEYDIAKNLTIDKLLVDSENEEKEENKYQKFIDVVLDELRADGIDPYKTAVEVYTTIDFDKQQYIDDIMKGKTWDWQNDSVTAGIAVVDVKNGELLAIGGGRESGQRKSSTATRLVKQIGSTAKPIFDYSVGIEYENWSTYEPFTDENISYSDGTSLGNWDGAFKGYLTLREALAQSRNTSAVKAFRKNKNENIKEVVTKMGLHPDETLHQAHAIGGYNGESVITMAAAYATFANAGVYNSPHSYTKVVDKNTKKEVKKEVTTNKVFSPQTAYIMTDLLQSAAKTGLGNYSNINGTIYGAKTGTSNFSDKDKKAKKLPNNAINDYWVSGISPDYAISVWYGYRIPDKSHHNVFGTTYHERLFQKVGKGVFKKGSSFKNPGGISKVSVENETYPAKLPSEFTPKKLIVTELFKTGTEPTEKSERFSKLSNVSDLSGSVSNNKVTLTWKEINTPEALNEDKIKELAKSLFEIGNWQNKFVSSRKSYNSKNIGSVVYKIYSKDNDGNLTLIDTTSSNSVTFDVNPSSLVTYVVKTSYSIFESNSSDGVEVNVSLNGVSDSISLVLNGDNPLVANKKSFVDPGIKVLKNGSDSGLSPTSIVYTNIATNTPVTKDIMINTPGIYTIEYRYEEKSITRNVTIN